MNLVLQLELDFAAEAVVLKQFETNHGVGECFRVAHCVSQFL